MASLERYKVSKDNEPRDDVAHRPVFQKSVSELLGFQRHLRRQTPNFLKVVTLLASTQDSLCVSEWEDVITLPPLQNIQVDNELVPRRSTVCYALV